MRRFNPTIPNDPQIVRDRSATSTSQNDFNNSNNPNARTSFRQPTYEPDFLDFRANLQKQTKPQIVYRFVPLNDKPMVHATTSIEDPNLPHYVVPVLYVPQRIVTNAELQGNETYSELAQNMVYKTSSINKQSDKKRLDVRTLSNSETRLYRKLMERTYGFRSTDHGRQQCMYRGRMYNTKLRTRSPMRISDFNHDISATTSSTPPSFRASNSVPLNRYQPGRSAKDPRYLSGGEIAKLCLAYDFLYGKMPKEEEEFMCSTDFKPGEDAIPSTKATQTLNDYSIATQTANLHSENINMMTNSSKEEYNFETEDNLRVMGCNKSTQSIPTVDLLPMLAETLESLVLDSSGNVLMSSPKLRTHSCSPTPSCCSIGTEQS